jgi:hypothetical protein
MRAQSWAANIKDGDESGDVTITNTVLRFWLKSIGSRLALIVGFCEHGMNLLSL